MSKAREKQKEDGLLSLVREGPPWIYNRVSSTTARARHGFLSHVTYDNEGIRILDEDWDTLIILDACRYDVFQEVCELPGKLSKVRSAGSGTPNFIRENFLDKTAHDTIYVSGNANVGNCSNMLDLYKFVGVWEENPDIEKVGQIAPESISDPKPVIEKALEVHAEHPHKRLIVHLVPPPPIHHT